MQIHVIRPGDTVWTLSRQYGVSVDSIIQTNGLQDLPNLVVGQTLVIPRSPFIYTVKLGDSIWSIGNKFNVSPNYIMDINNITNPNLINPGMTITIPAESKNYGFIEVNGYIEPSTNAEDIRIINDVGEYLTFISPFSYQVNADGSLEPIQDSAILSAARNFKIAPLMVITNFREGNFDTELAHTILSNESIQDNLIANIIGIMREKGYYGINIDFERISPEDRELYNNFLRKVVSALRPLNYVVSTALAPKTSAAQTGPWYTAHDYPAHGEIVDFVILMTYEWGWSGGPPLPVAPLNNVRDVINYAVSVIPPDKIMMGMPLYGYNWSLPYQRGGEFAPRVSPQEAVELAARYNTIIQYDVQAQSPFFEYTDENGIEHIVWFEDARSVQAKLRLASEYGLRGVSYWVLGVPFPQNWAVLNDMFRIEKLVP